MSKTEEQSQSRKKQKRNWSNICDEREIRRYAPLTITSGDEKVYSEEFIIKGLSKGFGISKKSL